MALVSATDRVPYGVPRTALGLEEMPDSMGYPTCDSSSSLLLKSKSNYEGTGAQLIVSHASGG